MSKVQTLLAALRDRRDRLRARPRTVAALRWVPALALLSLFIVSDLRGVDFGDHWDERQFQIKPIREIVESGILLPRGDIYPGAAKWMVLLPALPSGLWALTHGGGPRDVQNAMVAIFGAAGYLIAVRRLFIVVCALGILWLYGAALALRRPWWEAFIAAAGVGLSWEYAYHARWVATDCVLAQFSALTVLMLAIFHRTSRPAWLYAAAAAAGLGAGTKYPGVVLLVPVLAAGVLTLPARAVRAQVFRWAGLCAFAFAVYLVTTPATLLDPFTFAEKVKWIAGYYHTASHAGHTVDGRWQHCMVALEYFSLAYFSPIRVLAVPWFGAAVVGAVTWLRRDWRQAVVYAGFPVVFLAYFCLTNSVAIVRNYLVVGPFLALLAARGVGAVFERLRAPWARRALAAALVAALVVQGVWLVRAGESIRHFDPRAYVREAIAYVADHSKTRFRLSARVRAVAAEQHLALPSNVTEDLAADQIVFFARAEGPGSWFFKTNDPWQIAAVFGPREINFDWYCGWLGRDRVIVMPIAKARATNVPMAK